MKSSARIATIFLVLFFILLNSVQVYLIVERVSETKRKFLAAGSSALLSSVFEYNKLKVIDSASIPPRALLVYSSEKISATRIDSQNFILNSKLPLGMDTVEQGFVENILNSQAFTSIDLQLLDSIFKKALRAKNISTEYRIDTIVLPRNKNERQPVNVLWEKKRDRKFPLSTNPLRAPYNAYLALFVQFKNDPAFQLDDLLWPLLGFSFILLIINAALFIVYRTIRKQKRVNELKTDFINNITHEMKTPITIASAGLQALEHHIPADERNSFYLNTSKRQILILNEFVERILEAAVHDISDLQLKKEKLDLHLLLQELVKSYTLIQVKPVVVNLSGEGPAYVYGDRLHLETAFHNVIDNAIKYSGDSVSIDIDIVANNRDCIIRIRDNGMGIASRYAKNIFEKFFRVPQGDAQPVKGFGLGLYYVSNIFKRHSGTIALNPKIQNGTEFIITLPIYP